MTDLDYQRTCKGLGMTIVLAPVNQIRGVSKIAPGVASRQEELAQRQAREPV